MTGKPDKPGERMLAALRAPGLTWRERGILGYLAYRDGPGGAFAGEDRIAHEFGLARRDVQKIISSLCAAGAVEKERRRESDGKFSTVLYTINYARLGGELPSWEPRRQSAVMDGNTMTANDHAPRRQSAVTDHDGNSPSVTGRVLTGRMEPEDSSARCADSAAPKFDAAPPHGRVPMEPDFREMDADDRAKAKRDWRRKHGLCVRCADPLAYDAPDSQAKCDGCRAVARYERDLRDNRHGGYYSGAFPDRPVDPLDHGPDGSPRPSPAYRTVYARPPRD